VAVSTLREQPYMPTEPTEWR